MGLLLLRAVTGAAMIVQGSGYFRLSDTGDIASWAIGFTVSLSGAALLVGFLTPAASTLVALATAGIALAWLPAPQVNLIGDRLAALLVVTVAVSAACLGPGAFSLDARLFGRREVLIRP